MYVVDHMHGNTSIPDLHIAILASLLLYACTVVRFMCIVNMYILSSNWKIIICRVYYSL